MYKLYTRWSACTTNAIAHKQKVVPTIAINRKSFSVRSTFINLIAPPSHKLEKSSKSDHRTKNTNSNFDIIRRLDRSRYAYFSRLPFCFTRDLHRERSGALVGTRANKDIVDCFLRNAYATLSSPCYWTVNDAICARWCPAPRSACSKSPLWIR